MATVRARIVILTVRITLSVCLSVCLSVRSIVWHILPTPNTAEDIALIDEKQKYMYSVLERILQTDEGKVIVRSQDADCNV
jgi:hypothetical protein